MYFITGADLFRLSLGFCQKNMLVGWRENQMMHALCGWVFCALVWDSRSFQLFLTCLLNETGDFTSPFLLQFFLFRLENSRSFIWDLVRKQLHKGKKNTEKAKQNVWISVKVVHFPFCGRKLSKEELLLSLVNQQELSMPCRPESPFCIHRPLLCLHQTLCCPGEWKIQGAVALLHLCIGQNCSSLAICYDSTLISGKLEPELLLPRL